MSSVLIVDDLVSIHEMLEAVISPTGFITSFATDGEKALVRYKAEKFDLVLADIDMKPMDGLTLLKHLKEYDPNAVVIIMTAYASTESAVQALKYGAFDYLQKPFRVDELIATLRRGFECRKFQLERAASGAVVGIKADEIEGRLVGKSVRQTKLIAQVKKLAAVRTPVLLIGESGTGKTAIAEILHAASGAPDTQLVRIDCSLSSDENFRRGLLGQNGEGGDWIRQAKGGTLFLQHMQHLGEGVQKDLVSVLRNTAHGFRLVCTADEDLEKLVDEGKFHDELFYRVASLPLHLPPLRNRLEDIPLLVKHFSAEASNPAFEAGSIEFAPETLDALATYHWPGNLNELQQVVTQLIATTNARVITPAQLPLRLREIRHWPKLTDYLAGQEKLYIAQVLHACRGDKATAAKVLGVEIGRLG